MISTVQPLPIGNALRLFLEPPAGAVSWRVLRKGSDSFTGPDDDTALLVRETDEKVFVDFEALVNDQPAFYRPYYTLADASVVAGPTATGTPSAVYAELTTDVFKTVRDRLEAGLKVEVERQNLINDLGYIQVFTASPAMTRDLVFPLVTVHLDSEAPSTRALGESIGEDFHSVDGLVTDFEGWHADVRLTLLGWSLNGDERSELRQAIRRVLIGNLPVFADLGFTEVQIQQQDVDAVSGEFEAPVYQVMTTFSCMAPIALSDTSAEPIRDITARSVSP